MINKKENIRKYFHVFLTSFIIANAIFYFIMLMIVVGSEQAHHLTFLSIIGFAIFLDVFLCFPVICFIIGLITVPVYILIQRSNKKERDAWDSILENMKK